MNDFIYVDFETTGLEEEDRICQAAYAVIRSGDVLKNVSVGATEFIKPPLPIKVGAMAVSHITNRMVEDAQPFEKSGMKNALEKFFKEGYVFVAHNAPFDLKMLAKEGVVFDKYIDTKKLSHKLDKDDSMESHRLQYLRYYYNIELPDAVAHTADGDVAVLRAVHERLVKELGDISVEEQLEISRQPVLFSKFKFGQYNGNMIADVARMKPSYLEWLLEQKKASGQVEEDWIYTLEFYLRNT